MVKDIENVFSWICWPFVPLLLRTVYSIIFTFSDQIIYSFGVYFLSSLHI
jgi:hypothetical protein